MGLLPHPRHDGIDYGDYIEQITYLLFLKMADERGVELPKGCDWPSLREKTGTELTDFYIDVLRKLLMPKAASSRFLAISSEITDSSENT
jgi:hypothetical protein